jgi:hypothetical protein
MKLITLVLILVGVISLRESRRGLHRSDTSSVFWTWLGTLLLGFAALNIILMAARS